MLCDCFCDWLLVVVHATCLLVPYLLVAMMHSDSCSMAAWLLGWYQLVPDFAVIRIKAERVDMLIYLSKLRFIISYTTPDSVANRYRTMPVVHPVAGITE